MALSKATLSQLIQDKIIAGEGSSPEDAATLSKFADALADAIVTHITADAEVVVTSVGGVTTGLGTSGPGTGTIS